jgi:hypothetical protein
MKIDIIDKILDACYRHDHSGLFVMSLMHQYEERGSLSKKQLQGLYGKALKVKEIPSNWLATLEAKIARMPTRDKTPPAAVNRPVFVRDEKTGSLIAALLVKYPAHKQVLFLQSKYLNNQELTAGELAELEKFRKLLLL